MKKKTKKTSTKLKQPFLTKKQEKALEKWADSIIDMPEFQSLMKRNPESVPKTIEMLWNISLAKQEGKI